MSDDSVEDVLRDLAASGSPRSYDAQCASSILKALSREGKAGKDLVSGVYAGLGGSVPGLMDVEGAIGNFPVSAVSIVPLPPLRLGRDLGKRLSRVLQLMADAKGLRFASGKPMALFIRSEDAGPLVAHELESFIWDAGELPVVSLKRGEDRRVLVVEPRQQFVRKLAKVLAY